MSSFHMSHALKRSFRFVTTTVIIWCLPAYRHVGFAASVHGFGHRVDQVAADAEVAHLHLALSVDEHVGGLHICRDRDRQTDDMTSSTLSWCAASSWSLTEQQSQSAVADTHQLLLSLIIFLNDDMTS